jgi:hypothetical protein
MSADRFKSVLESFSTEIRKPRSVPLASDEEGSGSCAGRQRCRAAAAPGRFGFHLAQAVGVALQRSWPQVCVVIPKLHPQQKSWSLPTHVRTETRSKFEFPISTVQKSMPPPGPPYPLLDLVETVMIIVENLLGMRLVGALDAILTIIAFGRKHCVIL